MYNAQLINNFDNIKFQKDNKIEIWLKCCKLVQFRIKYKYVKDPYIRLKSMKNLSCKF